uniref:RING-type domain-containing protein n=1 Tax=Branchiostoma floridae TaxID=7739 RepID=C3ZMZ1_BRAFL|eukprot:XP_002590120.1 hypothetical protein BRAFLDRAFT_83399 [Branchiostoma floridae]
MATGGDSPQGSLEITIFECSICLQVYTRPKVLPCGHTFCMECLVSFVNGSKSLKCPVCQKNTNLKKAGRAGVEVLTDNIPLANLRGDAKISARSHDRGPNGAENPTAVPGESMCPNSEHRGEELRYYCPSCDAVICEKCWFEEHNDHGVNRLRETLPEQSIKAKEVSEDGKSLMEKIKREIRELEKTKENLTVDESNQAKAVDKTAQKLVEDFASAVIKRTKALKDELHNFFAHSNNAILDRKEMLEMHLAQLESSIETLEQYVNQEQPVAVFSGRKMLKDLIEQCSKSARDGFNVETECHNTAVFTPTPNTVPDITLGSVQAKGRPKMPDQKSKETDEVNEHETADMRNVLDKFLSNSDSPQNHPKNPLKLGWLERLPVLLAGQKVPVNK